MILLKGESKMIGFWIPFWTICNDLRSLTHAARQIAFGFLENGKRESDNRG